MQSVSRILVSTCLSAMIVASSSSGAFALRASETTLQGTKTAVEQVGSAIERSMNAMIEAMRLSTGENSSYTDKQIEASKRFEDAAQQNQTQRLRDQYRATAESGAYDPSPTSCLLAGLFKDGSGSGGGSGQGSRIMSNVAADMTGADPDIRAGGTQMAASVIRKIKPFGKREDGTVENAILVENPSLDLKDPKTVAVIEQLVENSIDSTPPKPVSPAEMKTPEGVSRAAARQTTLARQSAVREIFAMTTNMREANISSASYKPYIDQSAYTRDVPDTISELQSLDIRTVRYYAPKPDAIVEREKMTSRAILLEMLDVMSINTRLSYLSLEMQNRQAIVQGLTLASMNDN